MRNLTIACIFTLFTAVTAMASTTSSFMRDVAIDTMLTYAKELHQRGDHREAERVMARIKQLSRSYNLDGSKPVVKASEVQTNTAPLVKAPAKPVEIAAVAADPNMDLKEAIAKEEKFLADLNNDVDTLRTQIQAAHHE